MPFTENQARAEAAKALRQLPPGWRDDSYEHPGWGWVAAVRFGEPGEGVFIRFNPGSPGTWTCCIEDGFPRQGRHGLRGTKKTPTEAVQSALEKFQHLRHLEIRTRTGISFTKEESS